MLTRLLRMEPRWIATVVIIPLLYLAGWICAAPLLLLDLPAEQVSLTGTLVSFALFLGLMPIWARDRWDQRKAFLFLGLRRQRFQTELSLIVLIKGCLLAVALLALIVIPLTSNGWATWDGPPSIPTLLNALLLSLGVGLAEELIFRGWLQSELHHLLGPTRAVVGQAMVFSLVHTRFNLGLAGMLSLLMGLFLLGLLLSLLRESARGSLWAPVGLHGTLVGGWFVLQSDLLSIRDDAPIWLIGPGAPHANPIGSSVAIVAITAVTLLLTTRLNQDPQHGDPT